MGGIWLCVGMFNVLLFCLYVWFVCCCVVSISISRISLLCLCFPSSPLNNRNECMLQMDFASRRTTGTVFTGGTRITDTQDNRCWCCALFQQKKTSRNLCLCGSYLCSASVRQEGEMTTLSGAAKLASSTSPCTLHQLPRREELSLCLLWKESNSLLSSLEGIERPPCLLFK